MEKLRLLITGLALSAFLFCQPSPPRLVIPQTVWDVGSLVEKDAADTVSHAFELKNEGGLPVRIKQARADCGCTVVAFDSLIAPRGSGRVMVKLLVAKLTDGSFEKKVTVQSTAENLPSATLSIRGLLQKRIACESDPITFAWNKQLHVLDTLVFKSSLEDLTVTGVEFSGTHHPSVTIAGSMAMAGFRLVGFSWLPRGVKDSASGRWLYDLALEIKGTSPLPLSGTLVLQTTSSACPQVVLPAGFAGPTGTATRYR